MVGVVGSRPIERTIILMRLPAAQLVRAPRDMVGVDGSIHSDAPIHYLV